MNLGILALESKEIYNLLGWNNILKKLLAKILIFIFI